MRTALLITLFSCSLNAATFGRVVPLVGGASDLVLDEARGRIYMTSAASNLVQVYSLQKQAFLTPLGMDQTPLSAALSRDGKLLYVTCYNSGVLDVIDLDAFVVTSRVSLPARPEAIAIGADGKILVTTTGSGTAGTTNTLLLYDPSPNAIASLTSLAVAPAGPAAPVFPSASGRPFLSTRSQLVATPDGKFIGGVNVPAAGNPVVFFYETASDKVLRARQIAGASTVLAISNDGSRIMSGVNLYDSSSLRLLGQQNAANSPYPISPTTSFTNAATFASLLGGGVFSTDGQTLYSVYNIAPVNGPTNFSQLALNDPDNLLIKMGIQLPENLAGKIVISADGSNAYALSDSGFIVLPLSTIAQSALAVPATDVVLLTTDQCGVTSATSTATVAINNAGRGGNVSSTAQLLQYPGVANQASPLTAPIARPSSNSITFAYNAAARGIGSMTPPHDFVITSPQAINIPDRIRVYENNRDADARGSIVPIPVGIGTAAQALTDLVFDAPRRRIYIANAGLNRIEVYDLQQKKLLTPIKAGQLPSSVALTPDGNTLYVANGQSENLTVIDPDKLAAIGTIAFPPLTFGSNTAPVYPSLIAAGLSGPQVVMTNGAIWKVAANLLVPRASSTILGTTPIATGSSMISTPGGEYILLATAGGFAFLYDATIDDWVAGRQIFTTLQPGFFGPILAGPKGQFFVVNGTVLDQSLVPSPRVAPGLISALAPVANTTYAVFSPPPSTGTTTAATTAPTLQILDASSGNISLQVNALEGPLTQTSLAARTAISGRTMAVDPITTSAYVLTTTGLSIVPLTPVLPGDRPSPAPRGTVNIGSYLANLPSNGLIAIFGQNLGTSEVASSTPLPTTLGGTCVTLNNVPLPLFMVSPGQINAQIPPTIAAGNFPLVVRSLTKQAASTAQTVTISRYAPAVLTNGAGQILLFHADGKYVNTDNPANRDEPLIMYAIGLGPTTGGPVTAGVPSPSSPLAVTGAVEVFFGNPLFKQAGIIVDWSGLAPGLIGVYQLNLRVPGFHINGDALPVMLKVGNVSSPTTGPVVPVVAVQ